MSELSKDRLISLIRELLPEVNLTGEVERLSGGNINFVWRAMGASKNLIIKYAPPHIATDPNIPLSTERVGFEARILKKLGKGGSLHEIIRPQICAPELYAYDYDSSLLIIEDVGEFQELQAASGSPQEIGKRLGHFIGSLHRNTIQDPELKENFHNIEIQRVRNQLQYQPAWEYAGKGDSKLEKEIKKRTQDLGNRLLKPGKCLVMGDLWPSSILVDKGSNIRLIDWEFVHFGRPLQDVAHFAAHCWMWFQTRTVKKEKYWWKSVWENFWNIYQETLDDKWRPLFDEKEIRDFHIHTGAEILIRANGAFKESYLYDIPEEENKLQAEAINTATAFILGHQKFKLG